ncbi:MAG: 2-oxo acid dehydrogenase subunit E2, partial [Chromatiaceae bacterium]|nr:2-oxo acid dehydrogenase subunit E2 [Chromatiaceae bacterium]
MSTEVRVPALPESVADATVAALHKQPGEAVREGETLLDLETDKVVLEVPAPLSGVLGALHVKVGDVVQADTVVALIEAAAAPAATPSQSAAPVRTPPARPAAPPRPQASAPAGAEPPIAPAARRLIKELNLDPSAIPGSGVDGRVHKADVVAWLDAREQAAPEPRAEERQPFAPEPRPEPGPEPRLGGEAGRPEQRVPMTRLRARIAERLVQAQHSAAMLTTFNEVNLREVLALRARHRDAFEKTHGARLGLMSFFVRASVEALKRFPVLNATIDGEDILYHGYHDIGIAVSSERGLVVPILRNCDQLGMAEIEQGIAEFARKAADGSLSYEELSGGTFTITNGGVFGS